MEVTSERDVNSAFEEYTTIELSILIKVVINIVNQSLISNIQIQLVKRSLVTDLNLLVGVINHVTLLLL